MRRIARFVLAGAMLVGAVALGGMAYAYPALAAPLCPSCYGMEAAAPRVIVDRAMPEAMRAGLLRDAATARAEVQAFYGAFDRTPFLIACSTEDCDRRMGGRGARAVTLSTPLATIIHASPRGLNPVIVTHEFSHVELHRRIGVWALLSGAFPAWFDEGVAVLVSGDERYLKPGTAPAERCVRQTDAPLPADPSDWNVRAGKEPMIYADAVCRVLQWMAANGGKDGVMRTLEAVAGGAAFAPSLNSIKIAQGCG